MRPLSVPVPPRQLAEGQQGVAAMQRVGGDGVATAHGQREVGQQFACAQGGRHLCREFLQVQVACDGRLRVLPHEGIGYGVACLRGGLAHPLAQQGVVLVVLGAAHTGGSQLFGVALYADDIAAAAKDSEGGVRGIYYGEASALLVARTAPVDGAVDHAQGVYAGQEAVAAEHCQLGVVQAFYLPPDTQFTLPATA